MADMALIGGVLREMRESAGISREEVGARAGGVAAHTIGRYERGEVAPDLQRLLGLLDACGVDLYDLAQRLDAVTGRRPRRVLPAGYQLADEITDAELFALTDRMWPLLRARLHDEEQESAKLTGPDSRA